MEHLTIILQVTQIIAYITAAVVAVALLKADIKIIKHDLEIMKTRQDGQSENIRNLTAILTQVAVQDSRLNGIEEDIRELKHGKGFVADGEYNLKGKTRGT